MALTDKQQVFIEHYLTCWNATEAARRAEYKWPDKQGPEQLGKTSIQEAIQARLTELKAGADEVIVRLTEHSRGSLAEFLRVSPNGELHGFNFSDDKPLHLLKKASVTKRTIKGMTEETVTIELHDAQAALALLGRHHKLFTDKTEMTGEITHKGYVGVSPDEWDEDKENTE